VTVGVVHYSMLCANDCDFVAYFAISVYVVFSWCAAYMYSCSNTYVSVLEAPDAASRVHVDLACNGPLVVV